MVYPTNKHTEIDVTKDMSELIKDSPTEKKHLSMLLPAPMYENIRLLAKNEGMRTTTYIRERLLIPKLQEIIGQLEKKGEK